MLYGLCAALVLRKAAHWPDPDLERALPARGGWVGGVGVVVVVVGIFIQ